MAFGTSKQTPVTRGDSITATRNNRTQAAIQALQYGHQQTQGGNNSHVKLFVSTEKFQRHVTDVGTVQDDVPSGLCYEYRLNTDTSVHYVDGSDAIRAYDVADQLTHTRTSPTADYAGSPEQGDVFYVVFNPDSKRWEKLADGGGGAGSVVRFTISDVICPDDDLYDDVLVTTLVCEWTWHSTTGIPTDAYGTALELVDVEDVGCILDYATKDELIGVKGRAAYGYTKDDPDGFWALDSLCIIPECEQVTTLPGYP